MVICDDFIEIIFGDYLEIVWELFWKFENYKKIFEKYWKKILKDFLNVVCGFTSSVFLWA